MIYIFRKMEGETNKPSFFKHVFSLEGDAKSDILNICQYAIIAIIPVIILNKTIKRFTPEIDDNKSSLEIILEILIQVIVIFIMLLLVHKVITYIPTYSGLDYPDFNIIQIILIALLFLFSLNTSIAEKANLIIMRIMDYWEGRKSSIKKRRNGSSSGSSNGDTTPLMPNGGGMSSAPPGMPQSTSQQQQAPDYNSFYTKDTTPLVGAASPGGGEGFSPMMPGGLGPTLAQGGGSAMGFGEPMAANAVLGGGSFGGAW